ncbi:MAG: DUF1345 domain-containing protein [Acidimicrobiia bacterium]
MTDRVAREPRHSGRRRLLFAMVAAVVTAFVAAWFLPWQLTVLVAWSVAALVVVVRAWLHVRTFSADDTQDYATIEDNSRTLADLLLLGASLVSLIGVALAFLKANQASVHEEIAIKIAGIVTILLSWLVVHTIYTFRYAHEYYVEPVGGIDFKSEDEEPRPDYRDFAYLAFTIGMTYQVADTDVTQRALRKLVLRHALLSFVFGAVILATTVNLIANLLNS